MATIIDLDFEIWKEKVDMLIYAEYKLSEEYKSKKISLKEKNKIQKVIKCLWLKIWDCNPHPNKSLEEAFKLNFGQ